MSEQQAPTIQLAIDQAVQKHTAGHLSQAQTLYQQILQRNPNQPVALHLLGVVAHQTGKNDTAVELITKALAIKPDYAEAHSNLGNVLWDLGKLDEAVASCRKALDLQPDFAEAHNNLGNALQHLGKLEEAVVSYQKATGLKPDHAEAHSNLGNVLRGLGKLDEAVANCRKALAIKPDYAEAHINLGNALQDLGKLEETVASYQKAIELKPNTAEAHSNLGNVLRGLGKLENAVASYQKALDLQPDFAEANNNLGNALQDLGKLEEAVASYQKAIELKPNYAEAHSNLGNVLQGLGKLEEAIASYRRALDLKPDYVQAHKKMGHALQALGPDHFAEAKESFDKGFHISHGGVWWNAATFTDDDNPGNIAASGTMNTSVFKLIDTIDQLEYLIARGRIDPSFQVLADRYHAILAEIQLMEDPLIVTELTSGQLERLGSSYNRVIHYAEAPRIRASTVNGSLDFRRIEDRYLSSPVSVTTLDDFLMPEALHGLRDFCLESTIFFKETGNRFVSSRLSSGFTCDLLYQVAEEVKERFPRVLGSHHLANIWIYRYNNQSEGVAAHTDEGAVTFNFWITPNDANQIPDAGGIIIYTKEQPYDWDWLYYNRGKYVPAISGEIADFLADADTVTIPYRENRAVLFQSNLFHKSDQIHFRDGFENRRMNITLLFAKCKG